MDSALLTTAPRDQGQEMKMATFKNHADMTAAGYTAPRGYVDYRGFQIRSRDTSGGHSQGYVYSVVAVIDDWLLDRIIDDSRRDDFFPLVDGRFGHTESVWLTDDLNQIRQPGCFAVRYAPGTWAAGVEAAKRAIDEWYDAHPEAAAMHLEWAEWRAECDARQAAKAARWQGKMAARLAARGEA